MVRQAHNQLMVYPPNGIVYPHSKLVWKGQTVLSQSPPPSSHHSARLGGEKLTKLILNTCFRHLSARYYQKGLALIHTHTLAYRRSCPDVVRGRRAGASYVARVLGVGEYASNGNLL